MSAMYYSLILIGAHNGEKSQALIRQSSAIGNVILVEPVPWLFGELHKKYKDIESIKFLNAAVAERDSDSISFFAPCLSA